MIVNSGKQSTINNQQQSRSLFENVAIIGCGYVGTALADYWQQQGHFITATTTSRQRLGVLQEIASRVAVMRGNDLNAVHSVLQNQDTVVVSVAPTGDRLVNASVYEDTYLSTQYCSVNKKLSVETVGEPASLGSRGERENLYLRVSPTPYSPTPLLRLEENQKSLTEQY